MTLGPAAPVVWYAVLWLHGKPTSQPLAVCTWRPSELPPNPWLPPTGQPSKRRGSSSAHGQHWSIVDKLKTHCTVHVVIVLIKRVQPTRKKAIYTYVYIYICLEKLLSISVGMWNLYTVESTGRGERQSAKNVAKNNLKGRHVGAICEISITLYCVIMLWDWLCWGLGLCHRLCLMMQALIWSLSCLQPLWQPDHTGNR